MNLNPRRYKKDEQMTFPWYREPLQPKTITRLPIMTDLEFFWGAPELIDDERFWFRAFKPLPGRAYQNYFHLYTWRPFSSASDFKRLIAQCVFESIVTRIHGEHGKIIIQCCPYQYWDPSTERCIERRPREGKRPLFYKVLIPESDLERLLEIGYARKARKPIRGITIGKYYFPRSNFRRNIGRTPQLLVQMFWNINTLEGESEEDLIKGMEAISEELNHQLEIRAAIEEILQYAKCFKGPPKIKETEEALEFYYSLKVPKGIKRTLEEITIITARGLEKFFQNKVAGLNFKVIT